MKIILRPSFRVALRLALLGFCLPIFSQLAVYLWFYFSGSRPNSGRDYRLGETLVVAPTLGLFLSGISLLSYLWERRCTWELTDWGLRLNRGGDTSEDVLFDDIVQFERRRFGCWLVLRRAPRNRLARIYYTDLSIAEEFGRRLLVGKDASQPVETGVP